MQQSNCNYCGRNSYVLIGLVSALFFLTQSCKKGDTGPAGKDGNANVTYSEWFNPTTYTKDTIFGIWGFYHNRAVTAITQPILDSGTVLVYAKLLGYNPAVWGTNQVGLLPITLAYTQGPGLNHDVWSALLSPGNLRIRFVNDRNQYNTIVTQHVFRYVIIPGGTKIPNAIRKGNGAIISAQVTPDGEAAVDSYENLSYEELCRKFNIPG